uniref:Uncharacterized protein n=1 Tax=Zea mays TaxID=4577 RepID=A0A804PIH5_MAIZE
MGALALPPGVIEAIDSRRRAFLWAGEETVSGAKCLVNWERACLPRKDGGLGVRDLRLQNTCLLLKLLHRAHNSRDSAWARWLEVEFGGPMSAPDNTTAGTHWAALRRLLPDYHLLTTVEVGDGRSTTFWHDCWLSTGPLVDAMSALYSHARRKETSVCNVLSTALRLAFVPCLSTVAARELEQLEALLDGVSLSATPDLRLCPWEDMAHKLNSSTVYQDVVTNGAHLTPRIPRRDRVPRSRNDCRDTRTTSGYKYLVRSSLPQTRGGQPLELPAAVGSSNSPLLNRLFWVGSLILVPGNRSSASRGVSVVLGVPELLVVVCAPPWTARLRGQHSALHG